MTWAGGVWGGCGAAVRPGGFWLAWVRDGATWGVGALPLANRRAEAGSPPRPEPGGLGRRDALDATG
jgi:hypothetical protein